MTHPIRVGVHLDDYNFNIVLDASKFEQAYAVWRQSREANPALITEAATRAALIAHCLNDNASEKMVTLQIVALLGESGIWQKHATDGHNDFRINITPKNGTYDFAFSSSFTELPREKRVG